jgi:hypothetical protein
MPIAMPTYSPILGERPKAYAKPPGENVSCASAAEVPTSGGTQR